MRSCILTQTRAATPRRVRKKLLAQRERTQTIPEFSHEAFICVDAQGFVCEWNALAATTFGWSKEEVIGKLFEEIIISKRLREAHRNGIAHFLKTSECLVLNQRIELPAPCRDGREIPIETTTSVLRDGDKIEFSCFLQDISERKQQIACIDRSIDRLTQSLILHRIVRFCSDALRTHKYEYRRAVPRCRRFKYINDTYGHAAGDTLLKAFSQYLSQSVRQFDAVGRLGGDEFCIMLEDVK